MDGLALLAEAEVAGLTVMATGDRLLIRGPRHAEPVARRLLENKPAVLAALAGPRPPAPPDPMPVPAEAVALRVAAFRDQLAAWATGGHPGVPLLTLPNLPPSAPGQCVGCGEALSPGRTWRCAVCVAAVETVLGLPPVRLDLEATR